MGKLAQAVIESIQALVLDCREQPTKRSGRKVSGAARLGESVIDGSLAGQDAGGVGLLARVELAVWG